MAVQLQKTLMTASTPPLAGVQHMPTLPDAPNTKKQLQCDRIKTKLTWESALKYYKETLIERHLPVPDHLRVGVRLHHILGSTMGYSPDRARHRTTAWRAFCTKKHHDSAHATPVMVVPVESLSRHTHVSVIILISDSDKSTRCLYNLAHYRSSDHQLHPLQCRKWRTTTILLY